MIDAFDWVIRAYGREMACYDSGGAAKGSAMTKNTL